VIAPGPAPRGETVRGSVWPPKGIGAGIAHWWIVQVQGDSSFRGIGWKPC